MIITSLDYYIEKIFKKFRKKFLDLHGRNVYIKYLSLQKYSYLAEIKKIATTLPRFLKSKKFFVLIPSFYEGKNVEQTLKILIPKKKSILGFWRKNVVFIIFNNFCLRKPEKINEISLQKNTKFKDIFVINYPLKSSGPNVGFCRKILHDLIIYKALRSRVDLNKCIFVSFDADILAADLRIFKKAHNLLAKNKDIDTIQGKMTRIYRKIPKNTIFYVFSVIYDEIRNEWQAKRYRRNGVPEYSFMWNRIFTYGTNLFLRPNIYCEIGGFDPLKIGEDYAISAKISFLRATSGKDLFKNANVSTIIPLNYKVVNHPRRDIYALSNNFSAYRKFGDLNQEMRIRRIGENWLSLLGDLDREIPLNRKNVQKILSILFQKNFKRIPDVEESRIIFKNSLSRAIKKMKLDGLKQGLQLISLETKKY